MATPATLASLPHEVIARIASLADRNSFLSLLRVSRQFLSLGDGPLWEHLDLCLLPRFGAIPIILSNEQANETPSAEVGFLHNPLDTRPYGPWATKEERDTAKRYRRGLADKVKEIIRVGDRRNWGMVKSVTMAPQACSVGLMMLVLEYVHLSIRSLRVDATIKLPLAARPQADLFPTSRFDTANMDFPPSFPHLTSITITRLSVSRSEFCLRLVSLSPNLIDLNVEFLDSILDPCSFARVGPLLLQSPTRLRRLRFAWRYDDGEWDHYPAAVLMLNIIKQSPELEQVMIMQGDYQGGGTEDELREVLGDHPNLRDLRWPIRYALKFYHLRRLVSDDFDFETALHDSLEDLPLIETLYITGFAPPDSHQLEPHLALNSYSPSEDLYFFAQSLRRFPALRTIQKLPETFEADEVNLFDRLDDLERSYPSMAGKISSVCCGDDELIQLSLPREWTEVEDVECDACEELYPSPEYLIFPFYKQGRLWGGGVSRRRVFRRHLVPVVSHFADYRGKAIPPEIIQKMKEVAGDRVEDWDKRGVAVDKDVWAVLEDWYEQLPSTAEEHAA